MKFVNIIVKNALFVAAKLAKNNVNKIIEEKIQNIVKK